MQNTLVDPRRAMLTFILCIRNVFEPVKYRATYITYAHTIVRSHSAHIARVYGRKGERAGERASALAKENSHKTARTSGFHKARAISEEWRPGQNSNVY